MSTTAARTIRIGYFAAAADAAGCESEDLPTEAATIAELALALGHRHGQRMRAILSASSYLVGDELVRDPATPLDGVSAIDVLPPFAGG